MTASELLKGGDPVAALKALTEQVRSKPADTKLRVFLAQLLCVLGQWERALNQLTVAAEMDALAVPMKQVADEAMAMAPSVGVCLVLQRTGGDVAWTPGRDVWWHEAVPGQPAEFATVETAANEPYMILYTSGTTGRPKGVAMRSQAVTWCAMQQVTQFRHLDRDAVMMLNAPMFKEYLRFIANRRCQQIGLDPLFAKADNPFPWMAEMIDLKKEKNFFETRVTEYQTGGALSWD